MPTPRSDDAIAAHVARVDAAIEAACLESLEDDCGVLVIERRGGGIDTWVGVHPSVPYGEIHYTFVDSVASTLES